jgi:uncharacterized membrane protein
MGGCVKTGKRIYWIRVLRVLTAEDAYQLCYKKKCMLSVSIFVVITRLQNIYWKGISKVLHRRSVVTGLYRNEYLSKATSI